MDEYPKEWKKLANKITSKNDFKFGGDSLKRPPKGFKAEHPLIHDLKRKDFIAVRQLKISTVYAKDIDKQTARMFKAASPLVQFICDADDLPF